MTPDSERLIEPYIKYEYDLWYAGCQYVAEGSYTSPVKITEMVCVWRWTAKMTARRLARKARRKRDRGLVDKNGTKMTVGEPR